MTWIAVLIVCLAAIAVRGEVPIATRAEWNARPPSGPMDSMETPLPRAVIAHTAGGSCSDDVACSQQVRNLQNYQMSRQKFSDIAYHYLIGGNGKAYEGRSANQKGAFAAPNNDGSLGIAFIGNFEEQAPSQEALEAAQKLLEHAVKEGQLVENYKLLGHRQVSATRSPGEALYNLIQQWPHWSEQI
ncbi:peptidoglycan-recognition protein SD [Drosophila takahashii]|uniref:peptidoglycan-recognition protein SD n=1 Tax=Drosophila takahashii TaxID=29030 RepID=UPI001CF8E3CE|nr:peptidoglycan-recognition protein SD [Drosophila takahashii]